MTNVLLLGMLVLLLVLLLACSHGLLQCPEECQCEDRLDCSHVSPNTSLLHVSGMNLGDSLAHSTNNPFRGLSHLRILNLTDNHITIVQARAFQTLLNLRELHLDSNLLQRLDTQTFAANTMLHLLGLTRNPLAAVPMLELPSLGWLELDDCNLTDLPPRAFDNTSNLMYLSLDRNQLHTLPKQLFHPLSKLSHVRIRRNLLTKLDPHIFSENTMLQTLYIDYNPLVLPDNGPFLISTSIIILDLTFCNITHLSVRTFSKLPLLRTLKLSNNNLKVISSGVFTKLKHLKVLDLRWNKLTDVDLKTLVGPRTRNELFIDLLHNPLTCNCSILKCQKFMDRCLVRNVSFDMSCTVDEKESCDQWTNTTMNVLKVEDDFYPDQEENGDQNHTVPLVPKITPGVLEAHPYMAMGIGGAVVVIMLLVMSTATVRACTRREDDNMLDDVVFEDESPLYGARASIWRAAGNSLDSEVEKALRTNSLPRFHETSPPVMTQ